VWGGAAAMGVSAVWGGGGTILAHRRMAPAGVGAGWCGGGTPVGHWAGQGPGAAIPREAF